MFTAVDLIFLFGKEFVSLLVVYNDLLINLSIVLQELLPKGHHNLTEINKSKLG